jgi:hypothetical protein
MLLVIVAAAPCVGRAVEAVDPVLVENIDFVLLNRFSCLLG